MNIKYLNNNIWSSEFDLSNQQTCMADWKFTLRKENGETIIQSVEIKKDKRGCEGHPKTISALVKNIPLSKIDIESLQMTTCANGMSCGMALGSCVSDLLTSDFHLNQ